MVCIELLSRLQLICDLVNDGVDLVTLYSIR